MEWIDFGRDVLSAALGALAAYEIRFRWLRRDVDRLEKRVDGIEERERGYGSLA